MRGLNVMYEFMRRPSMAFDPRVIAMQQQFAASPTSLSAPQSNESTITPVPENLETYEIDDEFNLPISIAIVMLLSYMICGASIYCTWEREWTFFESFYFVFISISTIGEWRDRILSDLNSISVIFLHSPTFKVLVILFPLIPFTWWHQSFISFLD